MLYTQSQSSPFSPLLLALSLIFSSFAFLTSHSFRHIYHFVDDYTWLHVYVVYESLVFASLRKIGPVGFLHFIFVVVCKNYHSYPSENVLHGCTSVVLCSHYNYLNSYALHCTRTC